jgi:O-antigen ligase
MWLLLTMIAASVALMVLGPVMTEKPAPFTGEGSPARQVAYVFVIILSIASVRPLAAPRRLFVLPVTMLLVMAWCWISLSWSIAPSVAVRRLLLTTIVVWNIFLLVKHVGYERSVAVIRISLVAALFVNYVAVLLFPVTGIHQPFDAAAGDPALVGNWRGVMLQKNFAGALCAMTVLFFTFDARTIRGWIRLLVIAAAIFFLYRSVSKTSMGILVLALALGWAYTRYNPRYRALVPPLLCVTGVAIFLAIYSNWATIIAPYYTQDGLTGRVQIWPALFAYSSEHPLLGAGYGSFWNIGLGRSPLFEYAKGWLVTYVAQGHNGYLDVLITLGIPGLVLTFIAYLVAPVTRLVASRTIPRQRGALLLSLIVFGMGHNLTESSLLERDAIVNVFLLFAVALVSVTTDPLIPLSAAPRRRSVAR